MSGSVTYARSLNYASHSGKDPVQPRFFMQSVENPNATAREGRPIFHDEERVQFLIPGSPNQPVFRVADEHKERWPSQYAAFKRGTEIAVDGTPIEQWSILKRAQVMELKALNVFSVEQVADLSDVAIQKIGLGGRRIRELARAYLDEAKASALLSETTRRNEELEARWAEQNAKIDELSQLVTKLHQQLIAQADKPNPIATYVPGEHGIDAMRNINFSEPEGGSSLSDMPMVRKRGRPSNAEIAARGGV